MQSRHWNPPTEKKIISSFLHSILLEDICHIIIHYLFQKFENKNISDLCISYEASEKLQSFIPTNYLNQFKYEDLLEYCSANSCQEDLEIILTMNLFQGIDFCGERNALLYLLAPDPENNEIYSFYDSSTGYGRGPSKEIEELIKYDRNLYSYLDMQNMPHDFRTPYQFLALSTSGAIGKRLETIFSELLDKINRKNKVTKKARYRESSALLKTLKNSISENFLFGFLPEDKKLGTVAIALMSQNDSSIDLWDDDQYYKDACKIILTKSWKKNSNYSPSNDILRYILPPVECFDRVSGLAAKVVSWGEQLHYVSIGFIQH